MSASTPAGDTADTPVLECRDLRKSYGRVDALRGLDLELRRGEVLGFLGPNGAGKSTTIRILLGLLRATSGTVRVFGADPWAEAPRLHRRMAYVPGDVALWPNMSGGEAIDHLIALHGGAPTRRRDELIERFDLDPRKKGRQYSKGNRQKVAIVAALAVDADLLVLDEPTSGLDPLMERVFQDAVRERVDRDGVSVLLSSHILSEVETLADRITIIRRGTIVRTGTLADLQAGAHSQMDARLSRDPSAEEVARLVALAGARVEGRHVTASVPVDALTGVLGVLHGIGVDALTVEPPSLESLFLGMYDEEGRA